MGRAHLDEAASRRVDPAAVFTAATRKVEGVEAFMVVHRQQYVAVFRYCLEDEMPHRFDVEDIYKFRIDLAQSARASIQMV